ncbi:hypothetical protein RHGRI_004347 [Rhododendron griersonianum]|uniref:Uncharacterized protein n=1 Tax=Rhododendron griersonianum TaxID=479676 RepID=A0AAV6L954_9ERIC|nr:hypothetical protein RHGRI_004347 [Rhododendron griersonianum]
MRKKASTTFGTRFYQYAAGLQVPGKAEDLKSNIALQHQRKNSISFYKKLLERMLREYHASKKSTSSLITNGSFMRSAFGFSLVHWYPNNLFENNYQEGLDNVDKLKSDRKYFYFISTRSDHALQAN